LQLGFITFITLGIPYGHFFPEVPSTHLFSYPDLGFNIFAGIYYASEIKNTRSVILVDPGFFENSEGDIVIQNLQSKRVFIKSLRGDQAKVYDVKNHIQFYPYDLLYICSHAGEMEGKRLKIRFYDLYRKPHIIVIDYATGFGLTEEGKAADTIVEVTDFRRFVELDGVDWTDKEGLESIENFEHVIKTFAEMPIEKWEILESRYVPYVKDCFALKLTDHYCLILFHVVADHELPIVFNNACFSFYRSSGRFIFAGARAYIGTLTKIENELAISVAEKLFGNLTDEKPLPVVLWEAQRLVWPNNPESRTYFHLGCHFTNIIGNDQDMSAYLKSRLKEGLNRWIKGLKELEVKEQINETKYPDIKRNMAKVVKFLAAQIDELKYSTD
jgi:hypothetical protein